jgi:hypothetical protein
MLPPEAGRLKPAPPPAPRSAKIIQRSSRDFHAHWLLAKGAAASVQVKNNERANGLMRSDMNH